MKNGWKRVPLAAVCEITSSLVDPRDPENIDLPHVGAGNMVTQSDDLVDVRTAREEGLKSNKYRFDSSMVLYSKIRPYLMKVSRPDFIGVCSADVYPLLPCESLLDRDFLFHLLLTQEFTDYAISGSARAGMPKVNREHLFAFEFGLPSVPEQRRIVGILDEAFAGIATARANAEQNLQNARALFESHLNAVFTQRGDGWEEKKLGELGKVSMCKRVFKDQTTAAGDIPFYKIGTFGKEADAFIPNHIYDEYRKKYAYPKKGDVLVSAAGTIGRRVRYDGEPAYFQDSNIVWIDNDETQVLNDYLYHFYGACEWNSTKGATISRLYNDNLRQIAVAFPKSFEEQLSTVRTLDALVVETQRLKSICQRKLAALDELKKSLLHQAFSGEL